MTVPYASGAFRPHLLPGVGGLSLSGSIDRPQQDVLAQIVLPHIRIGPVEGFAGGCQPKPSEREPQLFANLWSSKDDLAEQALVDGGQLRSMVWLKQFL
jgi:hypothetical protein